MCTCMCIHIISMVDKYTIDLYLSIHTHACSTFFLVNPIDQVKKMYDPQNPIGMTIKIVCVVTVVVTIGLAYCAVFWVSLYHEDREKKLLMGIVNSKHFSPY